MYEANPGEINFGLSSWSLGYQGFELTGVSCVTVSFCNKLFFFNHKSPINGPLPPMRGAYAPVTPLSLWTGWIGGGRKLLIFGNFTHFGWVDNHQFQALLLFSLFLTECKLNEQECHILQGTMFTVLFKQW